MKRIIPFFVIIFFASGVFAQVGTLTVTVASSEPVTGLTNINYEFTGIEGRTYTLTVEVKFDDAEYVLIPGEDLIGDYPSVTLTGTAFSGTIVWNGMAGFPDRFHVQTIVRITAQHFISGDGVTDIDGNVYQTVIIDGREWMAENLRVTRYNNEDDITTGLSNSAWQTTTSGAYAIYDNDADMLEAYGALYNWYAVADARGLCPDGWRVPTDANWTELVTFIGSDPGRKLKSARTAVGDPPVGISINDHPRWNYHTDNFGLDEFDFSALPGGARETSGSFNYLGTYGYWWSSNEGSSTTRAWGRRMSHANGNVSRYDLNKTHGFSLRCLRDID